MKKVMSIAAAISVAATATLAGTDYPVEVTKDGVLYNCDANTVMIDGVESRRCVTAGASNEAGGGIFAAAGLGGAAGIALGALGIIVVATAIENNSDDPVTGTN